MTFDEALWSAFENNEGVRAADFGVKAAEQQRRAAIGLRAPTIALDGAYTWMGDDMAVDLNGVKNRLLSGAEGLLSSFDPALGDLLQGVAAPLAAQNWELVLQKRSFASIGATISVPIFTGGRINVANRVARIGEQLAHSGRSDVESQLMAQLVERYFGALLARYAVRVRQQVGEGLRRHLDDALALERNGMIAASERLYVEYKLAEAEREERKAQLTLRTADEALSNSLGGAEVEPVTAMFVVERPEGVDYFRELALDRCALLHQANLQEGLARENVRLQRADFFPQVAAMAGASLYNWQVSSIVPRWAVGVGVNFKLFDGLSREYRYSAAKQSLRSAELMVDRAESDVVLMVETLHAQMMNQLASLHSLDRSIAFAKEYLRSKRIAFTQGVAPSSELIDAELNYARARIERLESAYRFDLALAQLLSLSGAWADFNTYINRADSRKITY